MKFNLTPTISNIVTEVNRLEKTVWIVGGAIRDSLMGKEPKDLDLATDYDHHALAAMIRQMGLVVIPDQRAMDHGIVRVVDRDTGDIIDIARLRKDCTTDGRYAQVTFTDNIEEDLARRDFTVNAMAVVLNTDGTTGEVIDPFFGANDVKDNLVKFVGIPHDRVQEDYLRMIRGCRFMALSEDWVWDGFSFIAIGDNAKHINTISKERIRDEILKALSYPVPSNFFRSLQELGLLQYVFPDLAKGVGVTQNEYHAEPVFDHLLRCCDFSVSLTDNVLLRLATLCHDIAKPHTRSVDSDGRVHFYKHEVVGASVMYEWMKGMKFPRKDIEYVTKLVRHHQWRFETDSKDKTIRKWLQAVGKDTWRDLITLRCADRKGNLKKAHKPMVTRAMQELIDRVELILTRGDPVFKEDLAIDGHDLQRLGIKPGKIYQEIFSNILGIVTTNPEKNIKAWLEEFVRKNYVKDANVKGTS